MRGRRSSRSAAVVLAGCVGLAVIAPGLALAAEVPGVTTEAECTPSVGRWDETTQTCQELATESDSDTGGSGSTGSETSDETGGTNANEPSAVLPEVPEVVVPDEPEVQQPEVQQPEGQQPEGQQPEGQQPEGQEPEGQQPDDPEQSAPEAEEVEIALPDLQEEVDKVLPDAGANPIGLPNLPTIPQPVDGKFENVNDACLNAISKLEFPAGTTGLEHLSSQLQGFCHGLNTTDVDVCLEHLRDVLKHLCPTVIEYNTTINIVNWNISHEWWGAYWTHRYDVDCDEVTYDEANAILDWDRSDPFRLDRDDDGIACERNAHEHEVDYVSYPEGGVSTGDGSTGSGASAAEVALAAGALGGLGATGLVLVRRYARQG